MKSLLAFVIACSTICASPRLEPIGPVPIAAEGYASSGKTLFFWGQGVYRTSINDVAPPDSSTKIAEGQFRAGGCTMDVNQDGKMDLVLNQTPSPANPRSELLWLEAPNWTPHIIDTGVETLDLISATLFGRRGILLIHKGMQVRFYEIPADPSGQFREPWHETEIYSFYTPSHEGGLLMADVNGDAYPDILAGNYFIQSPQRFELPWHLWAIDTWTEIEPSAQLRVAWIPIRGTTTRVALQRAVTPPRFAWFEKQKDFKQLWTQHAIGAGDQLGDAYTMLASEFRKPGTWDLLVAERSGKGRLILYANNPDGFRANVLAQGHQWKGAIQATKGEVLVFDERELFRIRY